MIFLLKRQPGNVHYDEVAGFVVRADSENSARTLVAFGKPRIGVRHFAGEGEAVWLDPTQSTCETLTADGEPAIILRDFRAG